MCTNFFCTTFATVPKIVYDSRYAKHHTNHLKHSFLPNSVSLYGIIHLHKLLPALLSLYLSIIPCHLFHNVHVLWVHCRISNLLLCIPLHSCIHFHRKNNNKKCFLMFLKNLPALLFLYTIFFTYTGYMFGVVYCKLRAKSKYAMGVYSVKRLSYELLIFFL